jgi:hypothetical protein
VTPGTATPRGLGLYLGRVVREWDASAAKKHAERARAARIRHIALCAEALDGWRADHGVLVRAADVYRDAGCQVWTYSLPGEKRLTTPGEDVADALADAGIACAARGWILDAEESYRGRGPQLLGHRERLTERASERVSLGVTAYGAMSDRGFPWPAISGWGWLGYQLYLTAATRRRVRLRLDEARARWGADVVPHLATYDRRQAPTAEGTDGPARLLADLGRTCLDDAGTCDVPGCWLWSDASLDRGEADVLAQWAERVGW